jgi:hypothetical protein
MWMICLENYLSGPVEMMPIPRELAAVTVMFIGDKSVQL